jgi:hypothetical protein
VIYDFEWLYFDEYRASGSALYRLDRNSQNANLGNWVRIFLSKVTRLPRLTADQVALTMDCAFCSPLFPSA